MKENELAQQIEKCKQLIEKKLNWEASNFWTHSFYEKLSDTIEKEVNDKISVSTLKRIWGKVKPDFGVSIYTLNILARFVGYHNWNSFVNEQNIDQFAKKEDIQTVLVAKRKIHWQKYGLITLIIVIIFFIFVYFFVLKSKEKEYVLFYTKRSSKFAPTQCNIFYNIKSLDNNEKCHMLLGEGDVKILNPDSHQFSKIFSSPNHYFLKLYREETLLKIVPFTVFTNGWQKSIKFREKQFVVDTLVEDNLSQIPLAFVQKYEKRNIPYWIEYLNVNSYFAAVDCDHMEFEIRFKIFEQKAPLESQFAVNFQGDSSNIRFHLSNQANLGMYSRISEKIIEKNAQEQKHFVKDLSDFHTLKIRNIKQNLTLFFDNQEIYKTKYTKAIKNLVCLQFLMFGCGELDYYKISDLKGEVLVNEKFVR